MNTIDEIFSQTPHSTLYHYTGIGSLLGMVDSGVLWASHIYYLNDSAEIVFACRLLQNIVKERISNSSHQESEFLGQLHSWLITFTKTAYHLFVFSLTEEGNLLSQWRSYTPHGKGIAIGFNAQFLVEKVQANNLKIVKCLYESADQKELMTGLLNRILISYNREKATIDTLKPNPSQKYFKFMEKFRGDILQVFAIIKNPAFREEREWRIISKYYAKYTVPEVKFREGACMLVPYIEIPIKSKTNPKNLFECVILGPTEHNNLAHSALGNYVSNKKVCNNVVSSGIPYREW